MSLMMIKELEKELNQLKTYKWGKKQEDSWDKKTNFIYSIDKYNKLKEYCLNKFPDDIPLIEYAKARWYNHHTHNVVLNLFLENINGFCRKEENTKSKDIDLYIKDIPFDIKLSVYPKQLVKRKEKLSKLQLIEWLYDNQSKEGRNRFQNRIFILVLDKNNPGKSWAVKREFLLIKKKIDFFLDNPKLIRYNTAKANVIVVTKE